MPHEIRIDTDEGMITVTCTGEITSREVREFREEIQRDSRYSKEMVRLVDLRNALNFAGPEHAWQPAEMMRRDTLGRRVAFVVSSDVNFGLMRKLLGFADVEKRVRTFYDLEEATAWLLGK